MDNVFLIVIISLVLAILIILLIIRNRKDERELEDQLKNDYQKSRNHDADTGEKETIWLILISRGVTAIQVIYYTM